MKDATELTSTEIVNSAMNTRDRLHLAINFLYAGDCISGEVADKLKLNIDVLGGAVNILATRAITPEDIIG